MATNNAINLKSSGIASYDAAGTFSALANPLIVANGGTGVASFTAYAPICGGTTSTGNLQSIASVGTLNQSLTSNGASALPTMENTGGYVFFSIGLTSGGAAPISGQNYLFAMGFSCTGTVLTGSDLASTMFIVPKSGTIKACYGAFTCTVGSSQNATLRLRVNNTTDVTVSSTLDFSSATVAFNNGSLNHAVSAGDEIRIIWDTPTWNPTAPTNCRVSVSVYIA